MRTRLALAASCMDCSMNVAMSSGVSLVSVRPGLAPPARDKNSAVNWAATLGSRRDARSKDILLVFGGVLGI